MLSVLLRSVFMPSVFKLSVFMLNVFRVSVAAPLRNVTKNFIFLPTKLDSFVPKATALRNRKTANIARFKHSSLFFLAVSNKRKKV